MKLGSSVEISRFQHSLQPQKSHKKPCRARASSGKTQRGREVSFSCLLISALSAVPIRWHSQRVCLSNITLWLFKNFQFHIRFSCTSLLTCNLFVLLTSKSCQIGNFRLSLSLAVGAMNSEKDNEQKEHQFSVFFSLWEFRSGCQFAVWLIILALGTACS